MPVESHQPGSGRARSGGKSNSSKWQLDSAFAGLHISQNEMPRLHEKTYKAPDLDVVKGTFQDDVVKDNFQSPVLVTADTTILSENIEVIPDEIQQTLSKIPLPVLGEEMASRLKTFSKKPYNREQYLQKLKEEMKDEVSQLSPEDLENIQDPEPEFVKHDISPQDFAVRRAKELESNSVRMHLDATGIVRFHPNEMAEQMLNGDDGEKILFSFKCCAIMDVPFLERDALGNIHIFVTSSKRVLMIQGADDFAMDFQEHETVNNEEETFKAGCCQSLIDCFNPRQFSTSSARTLQHKADITRHFRGLQLAFYIDDIDLAWAAEDINTHLHSEFRRSAASKGAPRIKKKCCSWKCCSWKCCSCICKCCPKSESGVQYTHLERITMVSEDTQRKELGQVYVDSLYDDTRYDLDLEANKLFSKKEQQVQLFIYILFKDSFPCENNKTMWVLDPKQNLFPALQFISMIQHSGRQRTMYEPKQALLPELVQMLQTKAEHRGEGQIFSQQTEAQGGIGGLFTQKAEARDGIGGFMGITKKQKKKDISFKKLKKRHRSLNDGEKGHGFNCCGCGRRCKICIIVSVIVWIIIIIASAASSSSGSSSDSSTYYY